MTPPPVLPGAAEALGSPRRSPAAAVRCLPAALPRAAGRAVLPHGGSSALLRKRRGRGAGACGPPSGAEEPAGAHQGRRRVLETAPSGSGMAGDGARVKSPWHPPDRRLVAAGQRGAERGSVGIRAPSAPVQSRAGSADTPRHGTAAEGARHCAAVRSRGASRPALGVGTGGFVRSLAGAPAGTEPPAGQRPADA